MKLSRIDEVPRFFILDGLQLISLQSREAVPDRSPENSSSPSVLDMPGRKVHNVRRKGKGKDPDDVLTIPSYRYTPLRDSNRMFRLLVIDPESGLSVNPQPSNKNQSRSRAQATRSNLTGNQNASMTSTAMGGKDDEKSRAARAGNSQLMCWLVSYPVGGAHPPYTALSWAWGDPRAPQSRSVRIWHDEGRNKLAKELKITQTLETAFLHMRDKTKQVYLWVDALCINQSDFDEKELQMSIMNKFYQNASLTCVWLGKSSDASGKVRGFINQILKLEGIEDPARDVNCVRK
jgi:hypothetical protein